ncbi:lipopolysaccharide 1,2-glucosyltransferase [Enterobacter sp. Cy-643]|uniref:glycosyltransferase n=1 Tax=Enterobacter sp. Cy-643 TaxID=2608346 RepID=UPI00141FC12D|nr:glycosyltransferase [Enterobacter sp. Cy-643]NIF34567.1 lipopolysaccharide 1,2-glucosyltransferase [Enterobacter sp. Cy-643]
MNFDCRQAIKEIVEFNNTPAECKSQLHVAWGVDKNFMFGAAISMTSVLQNNRDITIHFHLFTDYIDQDYKAHVAELSRTFATKITVYLINSNELKTLPFSHAWSHAMYFRFVAFEYLAEEVDALLYIDADVMCKGSLQDLIDIDFEDKVAAVVKDVDDSPARRVGTPDFNEDYFNSGVMYTNLIAWKQFNFLNAAFEMLLDKKQKHSFPDQDVLNLLFKGKVIFLPRIYNAIYGIKQELKSKDINRYRDYIKPETILIHYVGVTKPWNSWANYPSAQYFTKAWQASPWAKVPLIGPRTPKQFKKKSRHERLQGKMLASIMSYIGYLIAKLKSK